jgi:hypothetical protein
MKTAPFPTCEKTTLSLTGADGARKLLYIRPSGRIYFIDTNVRVQFTGAQSDNDKLFYTLL